MKLATLLCATALSLGAATAQNGALALDEAIDLLKAQNLEIKAATYDVQSARERASQAGGQHWGSLDFIQNISRSDDAGNVFGFKLTGREANFGDFGAAEFMANSAACQGGDLTACDALYTQPPEALNYPGDRNFFQSKLQYTLPLYVGGKISAYVEAAEGMERLKRFDRTKLLNEKIYETRKAYYDMRLLDEALSNLKTIYDNIGTLEAMTQSMIEEGYAKQTDLLEVQAKKSNVARSIHQMEANEKLLYHYLSFLLDQPVSTIALPDSDVPLPPLETADVIAANIDVQRAKTGLQIRESMQDVALSDYLPMVGFQADVQTAADSFEHYAADKGSYTVGVQLKWNLFAGGSDYAAYEEARIETLKTKTQIDLAKKGIALQVDKIHTEIKSLDYEIDALSKELALAKEIYASYEARYREQLASMSDVVIKQSQQLEKVLALLEVKNKRTERVFALEKLANGVTQ
ncbi:TolC family protein [Sulfurimonas sp. HSL-3221]|uniref:TolC family protein n=1 Tax=Thiomicrolovo sulfuroxydans TaxID=2894755 RepID=UPI001E3338E2|nr:TolC family protein [Sulfurimonas sp. HSL-3221]UFS63488.1 TolC family protein [Sulfurimonas sp. HSL-3221]